MRWALILLKREKANGRRNGIIRLYQQIKEEKKIKRIIERERERERKIIIETNTPYNISINRNNLGFTIIHHHNH